MSMISFLNPPMFRATDSLYVPMPKFSANPAGLVQEIHDAIATLNLKANDFSSNKSFYDDYTGLISQAETLAAKGQSTDAQKAIWDAAARVNRALESREAGKFRKCIGAYLVFWLLGLAVVGWWLKNWPGSFFGSDYWRYLVMGSVGGIIIAIWGLMVHTSTLDFDRHFAVWYWFKPVMGAVSGLVAVITAQAGLLAVQGQGPVTTSPGGRLVLYILAFLAGFSERFFIGIIDRVMTALLNSGQNSTPTPKPATGPGSSPPSSVANP